MSERRPNRVLGGVHDEFWAFCARDELRLQRCGACGAMSWPPAPVCEHCGGSQLTWEKVSGRGKVISWCTFERKYYGDLLPIPWEAILVELAEGPLFISNPKGFGRQEVVAGLPVRVAFLECEDDAGPFRLPVFERA